MRILHVIPSVSPVHGGPSAVLKTMTEALVAEGVDVHVATTDDDGEARSDLPLRVPVSLGGVQHWYFPRQTRFYRTSLPLAVWLMREVHAYDLVHIHALFSFATAAAAIAAWRAGVPYVVRPLGVLNEWGRRTRRRRLKWVSFRLIEGPVLMHAAAVQWTTALEREQAADLGLHRREVVIANPVSVATPVATVEPLPQNWGLAEESALVLFLSRIDPVKGLDLLLAAFSIVLSDVPPARLVVAGTGPGDIVATLQDEARRLGVADRVVWAGAASGALKQSLLERASVFVLPSRSENFGLAAVEAMSVGKAVVLTTGVGVAADVLATGAGAVVEPEPRQIAKAITHYLRDEEARRLAGRRGRELVETRYSTKAVSRELLALYEDILGAPEERRRRSRCRQ